MPQATASERFAQGPYVAASVGFEPMTLRTKGAESTNEPPQPTLGYGLFVVVYDLWSVFMDD